VLRGAGELAFPDGRPALYPLSWITFDIQDNLCAAFSELKQDIFLRD
jgi:hypothetical protein